MLRNGQFIKEAPPKIGSQYLPNSKQGLNKEEQFVQNILLGIEERQRSFLSKVLGLMLRV